MKKWRNNCKENLQKATKFQKYIDEEIRSKRAGITVANETISEENKKLQIALLQKCISRSEIQNAQSQIQMGLQRKQTLEREILKFEGKQHLITKKEENVVNDRDRVELK